MTSADQFLFSFLPPPLHAPLGMWDIRRIVKPQVVMCSACNCIFRVTSAPVCPLCAGTKVVGVPSYRAEGEWEE